MSGLRPLELTLFYRKLRARGVTQQKLADAAMTNRAHLSQVLSGKRSGKHTMRRLARVLTVDELKLLEHRSTWKKEPDDVPRCGCGAERKPWRRYCPACDSKHSAECRRRNPLTGEARARANARSYLHAYVKRGKVKKLPCADCGSPKVEAHHADYAKPLEVTWLCRKCHLARHGKTARGVVT